MLGPSGFFLPDLPDDTGNGYHALELIHTSENGFNVKIIDFGLSDADSYNILKAPAGTKIYASPELLAGDVPDACSDIWSLGLIINELTGSLRYISSGCLRRERQKRYGSAKEVKEAVLKEKSRKIMNAAAAFVVLSGIVAGTCTFIAGNGRHDAPEQNIRITESEIREIHVVQPEDTADSLITEPVKSHETKKPTPKT